MPRCKLSRPALALCAGLGLAVAGSVDVWAQGATQGSADLQTQYEAAFQDVLNDPGDLDKSFRYAELAVQVGDYEGAIGALERMLLINPDLPRARLELGVLYFRLGSYVMSRSYLTRALESPTVPDQVRQRAESYLAEIEKRQSRHRLSGSLYVGVRQQSNANAGPSGTGVRLLGLDAVLNDKFTQKEDHNYFAALTVTHIYDFQKAGGDALESTGTAFFSKQDQQDQLDLLFLELTSGPRIPFMASVVDDATIRPYLLFSTVGLDDSLYLTEAGGGINIRKRVDEQLNLHVNGEFTVRNFKDNSSRPTNSGQDGQLVEFRAGFDYAFTPQTFSAIEALYRSDSTVDGAEGSHDVGVRGSLTQLFDPGIGILKGGPISFTATGAYERSTFSQPDPAVDPAKRRRDHEVRFNFITTVPILRNLAAVVTVGYTNVDSNIVNFDYHNFYYSIGASLSF